jgi:hypothetical protein
MASERKGDVNLIYGLVTRIRKFELNTHTGLSKGEAKAT